MNLEGLMSAQDKIKSSQKSFSRRGLLKFLSYFSFSQLMDPHTSGFIVKQSATAQINISGASYIFFAVS